MKAGAGIVLSTCVMVGLYAIAIGFVFDNDAALLAGFLLILFLVATQAWSRPAPNERAQRIAENRIHTTNYPQNVHDATFGGRHVWREGSRGIDENVHDITRER